MRRVSKSQFFGGGPVTAVDYEVLDSASESSHYFRNSFRGLHGMTFLRCFRRCWLLFGHDWCRATSGADGGNGPWLVGFAGLDWFGSLRFHSRMFD